MNSTLKLGVAILMTSSLVLASGCMQTEAPGDRQIGLEVGDVVTPSNGSFVFSSRISAEAHRTSDRTYNDVSVYFYSVEKELISTVDVGTVSTTGNGTLVTTRTNTRPHYVVIRSPEFGKDPDLDVWGLKREEADLYVSVESSADNITTTSDSS